MKSECLDYRQLPGQNPLFLSFLYDFEKVRDFYNPPALQPDAIARRVETVLGTKRHPRARMVQILAEQAQRWGAPDTVRENIRTLGDSDCVAVVSGQQVGLLGGPSYAVYKAATAIQLCRLLREQGHKAVPLFWLAADDSDFEEIAGTTFFNPDGTLQELFSRSAAKPDQMAGTVGLEDVGGLLDDLGQVRSTNQHWTGMVERLSRHYRPETDFRDAFASWLGDLFSDFGLICFDPASSDPAQLGEFYRLAVDNRDSLIERLQQRDRALHERGFTPQVHVDDTESLLFWIEGNRRFKIRFEYERYQVKGRNQLRFDRKELSRLAEREPQHFGTSALLRPILQDYLFPTALYVGGPAEIAYFSQLNAISRDWGLEMIIVPRAAFTVVDPKSNRLLAKHDLTVGTVLREERMKLAESLLRRGREGDVLAAFDALGAGLETRIEALMAALQEFDPSVAEMLGNSGRKIEYQLEKVRKRFIANRQQQTGHVEEQLTYLINRLLPDGKLQERVFNFNQFLAEEGPDFLDRLMGQVQPFCHSHQVLYL